MNTNIFGNKPTAPNTNGIFSNNPGSTPANNSMAGVNNIFSRNSLSNPQSAPNVFGSTGAVTGTNTQYNTTSGFGNFMASNSKPTETNRGIFGGSNTMPNQGGIFGGKTLGVTQPSTGVFNSNMPAQNNIFSSTQKNSFQTSQGIFNQNNQAGGFLATNTSTPSPFAQNNTNNSPFNQNLTSNNNSNSFFGNTNNTQGQAFGMIANNNTNPIFQNNQGNTNVFGIPNQQLNQMGQNGQGGVLMPGNQNLQQQSYSYAPQFCSFQVPSISPLTNEIMYSPDSIYHSKLLLQQLSKRISSQNLHDLVLHDSNAYSKVRISQLPFKQQIYTLLRNKKKLTQYIKKLQDDQINLVNLNREWSVSFGLKLNRCKELALQSIKNSKMVELVKIEIEQMQKYISSFIKPLYNSIQYKTTVSFMDPDQFCLQIASKILSRMKALQQKVDDLISANNVQTQEAVDYLQVLSNLGEYFEHVAAELKSFENRYQQIKRTMIQKRVCGNLEETLRRGKEKQQSNSQRSQMELFQLLKQIQKSLIRHEEREDNQQKKSKVASKLL